MRREKPPAGSSILARVRGVSWNDETGQVLIEIADGQSVPLSEIKRILD